MNAPPNRIALKKFIFIGTEQTMCQLFSAVIQAALIYLANKCATCVRLTLRLHYVETKS
jgi:hypothetical protein